MKAVLYAYYVVALNIETESTCPRPIRSPRSSRVHVRLLKFSSKNRDLGAMHGHISSDLFICIHSHVN